MKKILAFFYKDKSLNSPEYYKNIENIIKTEDVEQLNRLIITKNKKTLKIECELVMKKNDKMVEINQKLKVIENNLRKFDFKIGEIHLRPTLKKVDTKNKKW